MSSYSEIEISRIINECEILILPDDVTIEDIPKVTDVRKLQNPKNLLLNRYLEDENYFEQCFNESKLKRQNLDLPDPVDFSKEFDFSQSYDDNKPNSENALEVNGVLRQQLMNFNAKLLDLRDEIDNRLKSLDSFLAEVKSSEKDTHNTKTTYIKCGAPFFKDVHGYPPPENDDFKYRKGELKEFFPFEILQNVQPWTKEEKKKLLNGIKNQMIAHIKTQQSTKLCQALKHTRGKLIKLRYISNNQDLNEASMLEIYQTIQNDHEDFAINWNLVSFDDLHSAHSVSECMGMWYSYLKPDINQEPFTVEENAILSHAAVENKFENWNAIASQLNGRTSLQTFVYFQKEIASLCPPNVRWTADEDQQLLNSIKKYTAGDTITWNKIGTCIENRNKTQCYNRYLILMRQQNSKKGVFTTQENRILLDFVAKNGTDFHKMPRELLPNRSMVQIKNHYNVALKHKGKVNPWTYEEDKILMDFVEKEGTNGWHKLADILKTHNRFSCRTRHKTISKFLAKNPKSSLKDVPSRLKTVTAVHRAVQSDNEEDDEERAYDDKPYRSKTFGLLTFEEYKLKNPQLYSVLKTTYNYKLEVRELNIDVTKFLALKNLLNINDAITRQKSTYMFTPFQTEKLKEVLSYRLEDELDAEINSITQTKNFLLPPSYNTVVGLRAVAIKVHEEPVSRRKEVEKPSPEYQKSLQEFQNLFYSLFYYPAMMSKLKDAELRSNYMIKDSRNNNIKIINYISCEKSSATIFGNSVKRAAMNKTVSSKRPRHK